MCIQFLGKFARRLKENGVGSNTDRIELELLKTCKEAKGKDERLVRTKPPAPPPNLASFCNNSCVICYSYACL